MSEEKHEDCLPRTRGHAQLAFANSVDLSQAVFGDEKVVLVDVDLNTGAATVELEEDTGAVLRGSSLSPILGIRVDTCRD